MLFDRHFEASYRFAVHMLDGDHDVAQDAAQNSWVKVWRNLPSFRGESRFQTWLFTITAREVTDHRRRRRPVPVNDELLETSANADSSEDPEQQAMRLELWDALMVALSELPWRQRACWLLREMDGLTYAEIARVLDTTPVVVRGQLHRSRRALALRMEQWR